MLVILSPIIVPFQLVGELCKKFDEFFEWMWLGPSLPPQKIVRVKNANYYNIWEYANKWGIRIVYISENLIKAYKDRWVFEIHTENINFNHIEYILVDMIYQLELNPESTIKYDDIVGYKNKGLQTS